VSLQQQRGMLQICDVERSLQVHNELRMKHGAPPLQWSDDCALFAMKCLQECIQHGMHHCHTYDQERNISMGQNVYTGFGKEAGAIRAWYGEIADYNFEKPGCRNQRGVVGHFTQVVWAETTHVGMATNGDYVVANYFPAGNMVGNEAITFARCVQPLKPAFAWRPRTELDIVAAELFRAVAVTLDVQACDDGLLLPVGQCCELYRKLGAPNLADALSALSVERMHAGDFASAVTQMHTNASSAQANLQVMRRMASFLELDEDRDLRFTSQEFRKWLVANTVHDPMRTVRNRQFTEAETQELFARLDDDQDALLTFADVLTLHDGDLLIPLDTSMLVEGWTKETEKLLKDVPRSGEVGEVMEMLADHLRQGGKARILKANGSLDVKLIIERRGQRPTFRVSAGSWKAAPEPRPPSKAPSRPPAKRPASRAAAVVRGAAPSSSSSTPAAVARQEPRAKSKAKARAKSRSRP